MRDQKVRVLTVESLLFGDLKFYILCSPKILLQLFKEETLLFRSVCDFTFSMLPSFCYATISEILKKV